MDSEKRYNDFIDILKSAEIKDLYFDENEVKTHSEIISKRIGYTLKNINGFTIPSNISIAYVRGEDIKGECYYVISMKLNEEGNAIPESIMETPCKSDIDAKKTVLNELKCIMKQKK
jgi:hypothetical protein